MSPPTKRIKLEEASEGNRDLSDLPYKVLLDIFKYLDFKTISCCASLCKTFHRLSLESSVYSKITLKYNMDQKLLSNYLSKITHPKHLKIQYKRCEEEATAQQENYEEFESYVTAFLKDTLISVNFDSCRSEDVLELLKNCKNLNDCSFIRCKGTFEFLSDLTNLTDLQLIDCFISNQALVDCLERNKNLKKLHLSNNSHIIPSEVCETLSKCNVNLEELRLNEKGKLKAKSFRSLARCSKLRVLELTDGLHNSDPEDALQHIAAGCLRLTKLSLYGWKKIDDEKLRPILHACTQLKELDLRGIGITVKSCKEAALTLPLLKTLDVYKCQRIKKNEIVRLQQDFEDIDITNN